MIVLFVLHGIPVMVSYFDDDAFLLVFLSADSFDKKFSVLLEYPNEALDQYGNSGTWTIIYNQVYLTVTGPFYSRYMMVHAALDNHLTPGIL